MQLLSPDVFMELRGLSQSLSLCGCRGGIGSLAHRLDGASVLDRLDYNGSGRDPGDDFCAREPASAGARSVWSRRWRLACLLFRWCVWLRSAPEA